MYPQDFMFIFHGFLCALVYGSSISHTRRGLGAGVTQVVDFDCPEEFGYYPHPTDCTQYYVCVFGGALLESCTGGLMYSHELQTCDWPRNVGCVESNANGPDDSTASNVRVTDSRSRNFQQSSALSGSQQSSTIQSAAPRSFQRQDYNRSRQHEVVQQQLYNEDIGPAEEGESDRQQRVYRGQPSSLGQVQRDRDGSRQLKTNIHTPNVIPVSAGPQDKISVVSFGNQRPSAPRPQEQYRNVTVYLIDCHLNSIDDDYDDYYYDGADKLTDNLTMRKVLRMRRQVFSRRQIDQTSNARTSTRNPGLTLYAQPSDDFFSFQQRGQKAVRPSEYNFETGFKPIPPPYYRQNRYLSGGADLRGQYQFSLQTPKYWENEPELGFVKGEPLVLGSKKTESTQISIFERPDQNSYSAHKFVPSPAYSEFVNNATSFRNRYVFTLPFHGTFRSSSNAPSLQNIFLTSNAEHPTKVNPKPEKPTIYRPQWLNVGPFFHGSNLREQNKSPVNEFFDNTYVGSSPKQSEPLKNNLKATEAQVQRETGIISSNEHLVPLDYFPKRRNETLSSSFKDTRKVLVTLRPITTVQTSKVNLKSEDFHDNQPIASIHSSASHHITETLTNAYELDETKTKTYSKLSNTIKFLNDYDHRQSKTNLSNFADNHTRIEQIQANQQIHQLTSAAPSQSLISRPNEHYNASQRFQPDPYDQYFAVYDDVDIYRQNDYNHQPYQTPSSTPSSTIAHQYRGSTTHKQTLEVERIREPVQQQRNDYVSDIYSPPPAIQDFNDQYNIQIDDQQHYQQLTQSTPKLSSRSEKKNSTRDTLTESTTIVANKALENATTKQGEKPSSSVIRRSDSNSYFSAPNFGPSTVLLPPLRFDETTRKYFDSEYTTTVKTEKQLYSSLIPALRDGGRNFEPPKNGGALAKTFNSFDSLLSSFIDAITNPNSGSAPIQEINTTPPSPPRSKSSPETIVRSEIGRIHHDPIIITENFTIRLPNYRKPEESKPPPHTTLVVPLPSLSSTPAPPPSLAQNDYLAYFVEIEPKKPKTEEKNKRGGLYVNLEPERTTESNVLNSESGGFVPNNFEAKPKPYSDFVRLVSDGRHSKVQLNSDLELEPIVKSQVKKEFAGVERENQGTGGPNGVRGYQPVGKWIIAKDGKYPGSLRQSSLEVYSEERPRGTVNFQATAGLQVDSLLKQKTKEVEVTLGKEGENSVQSQPITEAEIPPTTIVSGPYKFLYVDPDTTTDKLSTLSAFGVNSDDGDRSRFQYKTNPESRVRGRFFDRAKELAQAKEPDTQGAILQETFDGYNANLKPNYRTDENLKYLYKTNPEARIVNRYLSNSAVTESDKNLKKSKFTPDIIVPDSKKVEEEKVVAKVPPPEIVPFREKPIQVLPNLKTQNFKITQPDEDDNDDDDDDFFGDDDDDDDDEDDDDDDDHGTEGEEPEDPGEEVVTPQIEQVSGKLSKSGDFVYKTIDVSDRILQKPFRPQTTTEVREVSSESEPQTETESGVDGDDGRKSLPRRIVKIQRNDLKSQRFLQNSKVKRLRKLVTKSPPIVVLEDLEEKTLSKENEIHPSYRGSVVTETVFPAKNKTRFRFTVEDEKDFETNPGNNRIGFSTSTTTTEKIVFLGKYGGKSALIPFQGGENDLPEKNVIPDFGKPFSEISGRPLTLKNVTSFENRATTKAHRGKFKPSTAFKLRLKPTTASPDSESIPGPHLTTRGPGAFTIGSNGNEINRGTPVPNRGTRPTLKPSTAIVSKASEFIDIYRYPPRRPQNLYATPTPDKSAAKCRKDVCLLPDCNCGGKDIPGGFSPEEIPQLVLLTFDDSVNDLNKGLYADLFERGRVNPNGCPISATFYVSHEWTDYSQVQNLYARGHEIASHSITHSFGEQFSQKKWTKEIAGQREILAAYGGVRLEDIRGMRAPFLAVGGNKMFKMLYDSNFTYDSSMPIYENRPPSWPYTLDYKLFHDCMIPPCPTKSYPGVWEVPMVMWQDLNGGRCSMGDACSNPPTADGVYKMLIKNFERHFTTNRAPFGLYYHAAWFTHEHHKEGFIAFLDTIVNMPEVWLVTTTQAIEWVRDPQPLSTVNSFPPFQCNVEKAKKCNNPKVCNLWHKSGVRYMRTCQPCPDVYPWTGKTGVRNSRVDNDISED